MMMMTMIIIMMMMMMIPASLFVCRAAVYAIELEAPGDQSLILAQGAAAATRADGNYIITRILIFTKISIMMSLITNVLHII